MSPANELSAIEILENPEISELEMSEAVAELMDGIDLESALLD